MKKRALAHTYDHPGLIVINHDVKYNDTINMPFLASVYFEMDGIKVTFDATVYYKAGSGSKPKVFVLADVGIVVTTTGKSGQLPGLIGKEFPLQK